MRNQGLTLVELLVVIVLIGILAMILVPAACPPVNRPRPRAFCQNNLKQIAIMLKMYTGENQGWFPRMHGDEIFGPRTVVESNPACMDLNGDTGTDMDIRDDADFIFDLRAVYPNYLDDHNVLICPSDPGAERADATVHFIFDDGSGGCPWAGQITQGDESYLYLGWALDQVSDSDYACDTFLLGLPTGGTAPAQLAGLLAAIRDVLDDQDMANDGPLDDKADLSDFASALGLDPNALGNVGTQPYVHRLREGAERFFITDANNAAVAQSTIPICWDVISTTTVNGSSVPLWNHPPGACNVLYMDGHVEFVKYPAKFPCSKNFVRLAQFFE